jgi:hypothetical protein
MLRFLTSPYMSCSSSASSHPLDISALPFISHVRRCDCESMALERTKDCDNWKYMTRSQWRSLMSAQLNSWLPAQYFQGINGDLDVNRNWKTCGCGPHWDDIALLTRMKLGKPRKEDTVWVE